MSFRQGLAQIRARGGLGAVIGEALFPVPEELASEFSPKTIKALRKQAVTQLGLGLVSAPKRAGLGGALQYGIGLGQEALQGGLGQIMAVQDRKRTDRRLDIADDRTDAYLKRVEAADVRSITERKEDVAYRTGRDKVEDDERAADNRRAAAADLRLLEDSKLRGEVMQDAQRRQYWAERLTGSLSKLRKLGINDSDPLAMGLLTELDGLGVNAYTPTSVGDVSYGTEQPPPNVGAYYQN